MRIGRSMARIVVGWARSAVDFTTTVCAPPPPVDDEEEKDPVEEEEEEDEDEALGSKSFTCPLWVHWPGVKACGNAQEEQVGSDDANVHRYTGPVPPTLQNLWKTLAVEGKQTLSGA